VQTVATGLLLRERPPADDRDGGWRSKSAAKRLPLTENPRDVGGAVDAVTILVLMPASEKLIVNAN